MGVVFTSHVIFTPAPTAPPEGYPELPVIYSIGSMANGSNHLILSDATGGTYFRSVTPPLRVPFQIGDKIIVEIGGEAGGGLRGTIGVGGEVAVGDLGNYFTALTVPKALVATILNITGGNDLTLDATAFTATTNARVYRDNTDGMNAEIVAVVTPGTTITWPSGTFAQKDYITTFGVDNCTLQGAGKRETQIYLPKGAHRGGIAPGGGRTGLIYQDMTIWGNAKWQGFMTDEGGLFSVGVGVWIFNCSSCVVRRVESFNVFQKACWSEGGSNNQCIDCNMIQEEALLTYNAQWYFGCSDATNCTFTNCTFYGVYISPGFETFRSSGAQFLNCISQNGVFSTNSSGDWLIESPIITITANSWISSGSFSNWTVTGPAIDINSNIVPPSGDIILGGIVRNVDYTVLGAIDPTGNYLIGARVGSFTPNILFDGGTFTYPAFDNSGLPGVVAQAYAIIGLHGLPSFPPTTNCICQDLVISGHVVSGDANIELDTIDGGDIINCTAEALMLNRVILTGNYIGDGNAFVGGWTAYWGLRAFSFATTGANTVRLRRDSDNAEQTFATTSTGDLDHAAVAAFKGAANLFCVTLFDQVGSNNMTQATQAFQPAFTLAGLNGRPILTFDGVNDHLAGTGSIAYGTNSLVAVINVTATGGAQAIYTAGASSFIHTATANQLAINTGATLTATTTGFDGTWRAVGFTLNGASSNIRVDYTETAGDAGSTTGTAVPDIGSGAGFFNGSLAELAIQSGHFNLGHTYPIWAWQQEFYGF